MRSAAGPDRSSTGVAIGWPVGMIRHRFGGHLRAARAIGIEHGQITTIHDPTNTNVVVDAPLDRIPLFVRDDAQVPLAPEAL